MSFRIIGTGSCVPAKSVSNDEIAQFVDTSDEWISQRTGIRSRYIAVEETTAGMSADAARKAMDEAKVSPEELDLVIVATVSADRFYPSAACEVQEAIGAVNAMAFDVNAGCTGFLYIMQIADGFFRAGTAKKALLIGAETLSKMTDWNDRTTCVLFGDGAGAAVLEADDSRRICFSAGADGSRVLALECKNRPVNNPFVKNEYELDHTHMDGQAVFKFAVKTVPAAIEDALEKAGVTVDDIDLFLLHQANIRIIESVAKRLNAPIEKFPIIMQDYGNISAASVPVLIDDQMRKGMLKKDMKVVMAGFGAGLTWSAAVLDI